MSCVSWSMSYVLVRELVLVLGGEMRCTERACACVGQRGVSKRRGLVLALGGEICIERTYACVGRRGES